MKKIKMSLMFLAMGAFVAVCVINFNIGSADYNKKNSMFLLTLEALSDGEGGSNSGNTDLETGSYKLLNCTWTITYFRFDSEGKKVVIGSTVSTCKDCAYNCKFTELGNCTQPHLCPINSETYIP